MFIDRYDLIYRGYIFYLFIDSYFIFHILLHCTTTFKINYVSMDFFKVGNRLLIRAYGPSF
jgi:hypothetical protein